MAFADEYKDVEAHGNTKLHVIHTNDKKQMAITLAQYERHLSLQRHKIVGIDLECTVFDNFLADPRYTFAGFSIDGGKKRLERVNLEKKITDDEHKRWATLLLSMRHIEYVAKDAYAAYEIWNRITLTQDGLRRAKLEKEEPPKKRARSSWGWGDANW
ncbi:uncharacterized protein [Aegilops tauschii subsp. strangulata]|uniref:uncharacterized protein n=1 Tax=Aegilops tauschii subsp. strangulata TaxID=200361 RepID=UPI003CC89643